MATLISRIAAHQAGAPALDVSGVTVRYDDTRALDDVSFQLARGERIAVVGPNGAGKSTLFQVIAGVLHPTKGDIKVYGHGPGGHICIAYVPQRSQVDWTFPVSVADVVMMGRIGKLGLFHWRSSVWPIWPTGKSASFRGASSNVYSSLARWLRRQS
jgi:ABC-type Mn2+/Zn2+ transport system ATPase subunit